MTFSRSFLHLTDVAPDFEHLLYRRLTEYFREGKSPRTLKSLLMREVKDFYDKKFDNLLLLLKSPDGTQLRNAFLDCSRYLTHPEDAVDAWHVNPDILDLLLQANPPEQSAEIRRRIKVSPEVKQLRELISGDDILRQETLGINRPDDTDELVDN